MLSRRALLEKQREALKSQTLNKLEVGMVVDGVVKNITEYGAFVDLGGIDGLLHITDMSWGRVNHPTEMFNRSATRSRSRCSSSTASKRARQPRSQADDRRIPWIDRSASVSASGDPGQGQGRQPHGLRRVRRARRPGVEGLIHISEMSWTKRVKHPSKVVNQNDPVEAVILDVDMENKRISLGMKQIEPNPWEVLEEKYPVGTVVIVGKIRNITDFGIFIGIEEGIDGLVHVSDISWTHKVKQPGRDLQEGRRGRGRGPQHRRGEGALQPRHQAATRRGKRERRGRKGEGDVVKGRGGEGGGGRKEEKT